MSFPRYERYKDSGVEWLGEVPEHWVVTPVRNIAKIINGYPFDSKFFDPVEGFPLIRIRDLNSLDCETYYKGDFVERAAINSDDVLIGMDGDFNIGRWQGGGTALLNQRMCCVRGRNSVITRLIEYALPVPLKIVNQVTFSTTVKHLSSSQVEKSFIAVPPEDGEQEAIASFLDRETCKIDALIAEQQRLIELLKEKRQAVISHAVTKGLNPDAPMKDSGIEWLGEVPAHWQVGPLKRFAYVIDCKHHTVQFLDEGWPIVSIRELREDRIDLSDAKLTSRAEWEFLRDGRIPQPGDMIFCRNASVGAVGYVDFDEPFCMGQDVCLIRPDSKSQYMHFQLTSILTRNQIEALLVGATIRRANVEEIRSLLVAHPSPDEQNEIAKYLSAETTKFDALSADAEQAIGLLKERRSALISAAVTGKIDVREFA